jgi:DedD protein
MLRSVRDEEIEAESPKKDVELTLGPAMVLGFVCGLLLLCGLCFGIGYTAGRRNGSQMVAAKVAPSGQTLAEQAASAHKPAATAVPEPVQTSSSNPAAATDPTVVPSTSTPPPASQSPQQSEPAAVRPAITPSPASEAGSSASTPVQTALPAGAGIMVQIAAV